MGKSTHLWTLDVALARGVEFEFKGKQWKFSALTYNDWGDVIAKARSEAVAAYLDGCNNRGMDHRQRAIDLATILFGATAQHTMEAMRTPTTRRMVLRKSLSKHHPDVTEVELDMFLEEEHQANLYADIIELMSLGPGDPEEMQKTEPDGDGNPTSTDPSQSTMPTSASSSHDSDSVSSKPEI